MEKYIFEIIGALGLLLISSGILLKNRKREDVFYIVGGVCLEIYSIYIKDPLFIILQIIFILSAIYNLLKLAAHGSKKSCKSRR